MNKNPDLPNSKPWPWPDWLDALIAAPAHHQLLLEDERVRVLHTHIAAGDVVPLHTHRWGGVAYLQSWSHFIRRDEGGDILFDSRQSDPPKIPCAEWMRPLPPHTVENLGPLEISILLIEFKTATPRDEGAIGENGIRGEIAGSGELGKHRNSS